jgi:drug/metabolite transporter (DMT)-like permease
MEDNMKENFIKKMEENTSSNDNNNKNSEPLRTSLEIMNNDDNKSENLMTKTQIPNQENLGMIFSLISNFFIAFGTFWTKVVQMNYPNDFKTIQFLFLRSISIIFFALFHTFITKVPLVNPLTLNQKFWFFIRTNVNFFGVCAFTLCLWYLRSSTAQILFSLSPIIVFVLSYFILKEKLYWRYAYGTVICIIGSIFIISNEKKSKETSGEETKTLNDIIIGTTLGVINIFCVAFVVTANKILVNNKVPVGTQMLYVGISTFTYSIIFTLIFRDVCLKPGFLILCLFHGFFFYLGNFFANEAYKRIQISKVIIFNYLQIVFVIILSLIFLKEPIFLTDFLGFGLILGYMLYNTLNPLPNK